MNRADIIDWIIAAYEATQARGLAFNQYTIAILGYLSMIAETAPFVESSTAHLFEQYEGRRAAALDAVFREPEPVPGQVFCEKLKEPNLGCWRVSWSGYTPGPNHAGYLKELGSYLSILDLADRGPRLVAWSALVHFIDGDEEAYEAMWRFAGEYLKARSSSQCVDALFADVADLVGRIAVRRDHPYLASLAAQAREHRPLPCSAPATFGL